MEKTSITAIVLAGGLSSRMNGQDKGLLTLKDKPLYQHVIDHIKYQVDSIMISCNRNAEQYQSLDYPTFSDDFKDHLGPLSGIYSGLLRSKTDWNLIVSCDTPFLPDDLVSRLSSQIANHQAAYVFDGEHCHPTILLIHKNATAELKQYLEQGDRKLMLFLQKIDAIPVSFSDKKHCFINVNTPMQLEMASKF